MAYELRNMTAWHCLRAGVAAGALALLAAVAARAEPAAAPVGRWLTGDGNGVIAVAPCGDALCGRIVGIRRAAGETMPQDWQGRPQCGLTILRDEKPDGNGSWRGTITDPRDGTRYHAQLWLDRAGNLNVRGYVGIPLLGRTQTWRPYAGRLGDACAMLPPALQPPPTRAHP